MENLPAPYTELVQQKSPNDCSIGLLKNLQESDITLFLLQQDRPILFCFDKLPSRWQLQQQLQ